MVYPQNRFRSLNNSGKFNNNGQGATGPYPHHVQPKVFNPVRGAWCDNRMGGFQGGPNARIPVKGQKQQFYAGSVAPKEMQV